MKMSASKGCAPTSFLGIPSSAGPPQTAAASKRSGPPSRACRTSTLPEATTAAEQRQNQAMQRDLGRGEAQRRGAIMQHMQARGLGGSGSQLAAQLASQQGTANRAADMGSQFAIAGQQRALQALQNAGQMAGQQRGQSFDESATRGSAVRPLQREQHRLEARSRWVSAARRRPKHRAEERAGGCAREGTAAGVAQPRGRNRRGQRQLAPGPGPRGRAAASDYRCGRWSNYLMALIDLTEDEELLTPITPSTTPVREDPTEALAEHIANRVSDAVDEGDGLDAALGPSADRAAIQRRLGRAPTRSCRAGSGQRATRQGAIRRGAARRPCEHARAGTTRDCVGAGPRGTTCHHTRGRMGHACFQGRAKGRHPSGGKPQRGPGRRCKGAAT